MSPSEERAGAADVPARAARAARTSSTGTRRSGRPRPLAAPGDARRAAARAGRDSSTARADPRGEALARGRHRRARAPTGSGPRPERSCSALAAGVGARRLAAARLRGAARRRRATGSQFEPGDAQTLASHLAALISDPELLRARRAAPRRASCARRSRGRGSPTSSRQVYDEPRRAAARPGGDRRLRARLASRRLIDVDLHMHTDHSYDCATPVEVLLAEARARGLGAIAITDHNEISGALEARAKADGIKVIVAEEVKTADQGEVIGLFIEEKIPRGMTLQETIAEIKRQGGLVYVPHPFDRLHSVPDYEHLLDVLDDVDAIEVFNPRVAISRVQRGGGAVRGQVPDPGGRRLRRARPPGARLGADPDARLRRAARSSWSRCATPTSSATRPACCTCRRSSSCRPRRCPGRRAGPRATAACAGQRVAIAVATGRSGASPDARARTSSASRPIRRGCPRPTTRSARSTSSARSAS